MRSQTERKKKGAVRIGALPDEMQNVVMGRRFQMALAALQRDLSQSERVRVREIGKRVSKTTYLHRTKRRAGRSNDEIRTETRVDLFEDHTFEFVQSTKTVRDGRTIEENQIAKVRRGACESEWSIKGESGCPEIRTSLSFIHYCRISADTICTFVHDQNLRIKINVYVLYYSRTFIRDQAESQLQMLRRQATINAWYAADSPSVMTRI